MKREILRTRRGLSKIFIKHDYELLKKLAEASDVSPDAIRKNSIKIMKALIELAYEPLPEDKEDAKYEL